MQLRPYQETLLSRSSDAMSQGCRRLLIVCSTGSGKTAIASFMTKTTIERKPAPVWFLVHRRELVTQTWEAFAKAGIDCGIVAAGERLHPDRMAQVILIPSLKSRIHQLPPPRLLIPDEAHHCVASTHSEVLTTFPKAWICGLTATPERLDGKGLGSHFNLIVEGPSMRWLIEEGYLVDYRLFGPQSVDTEGLHTVAGDFNKTELQERMRKSTIVGDAVTEYLRHAPGKRAIVRSISRDYSREVAQAFQEKGIATEHLDGSTPDVDRRRVYGQFKSGALTVLSNVELFSEGVDVPGVEVVIDLRPTKSLSMYMQFVGRALRPVYADGFDLLTREGRLAAIAASHKPCAIIIDHANNWDRHGLPDEEREWSLSGRLKRDKKKIFSCSVCYGVFDHPFSVCSSCGAINQRDATMTGGGRVNPEQVQGELAEIDKKKVRKKVQFSDERMRAARTFEDLQAYGAEKGYKPNWAVRIWEVRQRKRGLSVE